jgi:MerR family Zn(II)-responsive transcriptional regulator of zntA
MLIGELAKRANVSKDTIRYYEELNLLVSGDRVAGSRIYREYNEENISRIQMIKSAKDMGFTLSELQKLIDDYDSGKMSDSDVVKLLREQLQLVEDKITSLKKTESVLLNKLKNYE